MCGRCAATVSPHVIEKIAGSKVFHGSERYRTNYNCAPQCHLPCILPGTESTYELNALRWGIDSVGQHKPVINARSENLKSSPLWRKLLKKRCVVVIQGYYEWLNETKSAKKKPFFIHHSSTGEYACLDAPAVVKEVKEEDERRASTGLKSPALKKVKEEDVQDRCSSSLTHRTTLGIGMYAYALVAPISLKRINAGRQRGSPLQTQDSYITFAILRCLVRSWQYSSSSLAVCSIRWDSQPRTKMAPSAYRLQNN